MEKRSELAGPSPYRAEEPQRKNDLAQDYTQNIDGPNNAPGEQYLWVCDGKHILVGPKGGLPILSLWRQMTGTDEMHGPYAHGSVEVIARWNAEWMVRDSNISLHLVDKMLRKYSKDMGWKYRAITDEGGMPFEGFKTGMADRSGNPEIDNLIEQFLKQPQGDWTTDNDPIEALRDPTRSHGSCAEVTEQFVEFAKAQGFNAYVTDTDMDEMGYTPTGEPHGDVGDEEGNPVPGFYPEHTVASIYIEGQNWPIIVDFTATQYGYTDHPKVSKTGASPGIGDINPGIKDWKNNEWSDTEQWDQNSQVDYYGEQNPTDDEPAPGPRVCSECGVGCPDYDSWRIHVERSHINPERKPNPMPMPVIDMDQQMPADFNTLVMDKTVQRQSSVQFVVSADKDPSAVLIKAVMPGAGEIGGIRILNADTTPKPQGINVLPEYQRQGVATALWREAQRRFPEMQPDEHYTDAGAAWIKSINPDIKLVPHEGPFGATYKTAAGPQIAGPIPFIYDIEQDRVYVGHPGERHSDIMGRFTPGGILEGLYKPDGKVEIRTDTDMPYTVRHLIELWYAMHPELPVKSLVLLVGQEQYKLASSNIGNKVRNLAFTDPAVQEVYPALAHYGNVFVVGGAVRDVVLGKLPKDFDLMVQGIDANTVDTILRSLPGYVAESADGEGKTQHVEGKAYGIFRYVTQGGYDVEVALPRTEQSTGASNADFDVTSDPFMSVEQDMGRRDFTANSMAVNMATGDLIDPYNGVQDTREGVLRTTNEDAFSEDPVRIIRALTAMSKHGFHLDPPLEKMLKENAHRIKNIKEHRTYMELDKLFEGDDPTRAMEKAMDLGIMHHLMPEVAATQGFDQKSKYHRHNLDHHLMNVLRATAEQSPDKDLRLAALLHDIGKPASQWIDDDGYGHYYYDKEGDRGAQHADVGAEMAHSLLSRLNYPGKRVKRIQHLIQHHMFPSFTGPNGAKKFLKNVGSEHAFDLLKLRRADGGGKGINEWENTTPVELQEQLVQNILHHNEPYSLKDLAINGHDLMEAGIPEGKGMGQILNQLADAVLENPALNNPETLKALAQQWFQYNNQPTHMPQTVDENGQPLAEPTTPPHQANILDPIHEELDPDVFDNHDQHAPSVKPRIVRWVKHHIHKVMRENAWPDPDKYLTLVLTGSLTTYQWSHHSDFDVSLWIDSKTFPTWARADLIRLMVENMDGTIVPGTTHPIQCYVVPPHIRREQLYRPGLRSGYDLDTQQWIVKPEHNRTVDVERDMPNLIQLCKWVEDKMRLLLTYHPDAAKTFWDAIHHARQRDMRAGKGDYAESNVIYKWLSQKGLFPLIADVTGEYIASARMESHGWSEPHTSAEETEGTEGEEAPSAEGVWSSPAAPGSQPDPGDAGAAQPVGFSWPTAEGVLALGPIAVDNWQGVRDPGLVDAAIGATMNQHYYGGVNDAFELAAHFINNIQRQQGIVEGNKRTAVATGIAFLMDNGYPEAYNLLQDEPLPMGEMMESDLPFSRQVVAMAEGNETPEQLAAYMRRHVLHWQEQDRGYSSAVKESGAWEPGDARWDFRDWRDRIAPGEHWGEPIPEDAQQVRDEQAPAPPLKHVLTEDWFIYAYDARGLMYYLNTEVWPAWGSVPCSECGTTMDTHPNPSWEDESSGAAHSHQVNDLNATEKYMLPLVRLPGEEALDPSLAWQSINDETDGHHTTVDEFLDQIHR